MGEKMEIVTDFIFLGSKITSDGDYTYEIKRALLLGRKAMTNLDSILKSKDISLLTKVLIVKAMVFLVVMYGCESWKIKKAERLSIDAFETVWRLLRAPWTARRSNQSILKEINPEYSLEGLMLKLHHFGHLMQKAVSLEKTLMLGKIESRRRRGNRRGGGWMASPTQWTWVWVSSRSWWWTRRAGVLRSTGSQRVGHDWATGLNWLILSSKDSVSFSLLVVSDSLQPLGLQLVRLLCPRNSQARILEWVAKPPPGDLPNPGIEPRSPTLQTDSLLFEPPGKHF